MDRPIPETIPLSPGVYIYKDRGGKILYVGKARVLRRRVLSYFRPTGLPAKTMAMLARAQSIEYFPVTTEKEALLLEASLIKKHRPPYNIVLRDDKNYFLFRINPRQPFPRLEIVRKVRKDGAKYFGPFTSALAARETWKLLHKAFPLRKCRDRAMKNRVRPCLYHHMGQCAAPCMGLADSGEYARMVRKVCDILGGQAGPLLEQMERDMLKAADECNFERAAELRDQIQAVRKTVERQAAILPGAQDMDAIGIYEAERGLALAVVFVRNGAVGEHRAFYWPGLGLEDAQEAIASFLNQFYMQASPPPRILLPWLPGKDLPQSDPAEELALPDWQHAPDPANGASARQPTDPALPGSAPEPEETPLGDRSAIEQLLTERRGGNVRLVAPQNAADNQLIDLARASAKEETRRRAMQSPDLILEKLAALLHLAGPPLRIECVDVSHISGRQTRVGMVVYESGLPDKAAWRLYSMPDSSDDYGTLYHWTARRLESGEPWPSLLLIDGGKGQLASVEKGLAEAGRPGLFPLAAIAKARDEHGHADRRAGNVSDRVFVPGRSNPLAIREGSPELLFLQQIRDATHLYSIQGHRKARRKAAFSGEVMRLPGVGPATARLLWDKFSSLESMKAATEEQLQEIPGIGKARARTLAQKLREM